MPITVGDFLVVCYIKGQRILAVREILTWSEISNNPKLEGFGLESQNISEP